MYNINYREINFNKLTLGEKQRVFPLMQAELILYAYELGYRFSEGDGFRAPSVFGEIGESKGYGHRNSCHKYKLAHDWNLYKLDKNGKAIYQKDTEAFIELGIYWKGMNPACCWGGDFKNSDGNHFSIEHNGSK